MPHCVRIASAWAVTGCGRVARARLSPRAFRDIDGELTEVSELAGIQRPDLILINDGDLAYAKVRLDERSAAAARDHINASTERSLTHTSSCSLPCGTCAS